LMRKKVFAGTPRRLKALTGPFFLEAERAMPQHSTLEQVSKCGCCAVVSNDTMYLSIHTQHGGQHGS
jgi:hypothetical protein